MTRSALLLMFTFASCLFYGCKDSHSTEENGETLNSKNEQRFSNAEKNFSGEIEKNTVVSIAYVITNTQGEILLQAEKEKPSVFIYGIGAMVPGLEEALTGKKAGDELSVSLGPDKAYGERDEKLIQTVPRSKIGNEDSELNVGMKLEAKTTAGPRLVTVSAIEGDMVTLDANHPFAGMPLNFQVQVISVRMATKEEIEHRHVHGHGGVKH